MSTTGEKVRQLAPHWAVMFIVMFVVLAVVDRVIGGLGFAASMGLVLAIAFGYPFFLRAVGLAPPVWER